MKKLFVALAFLLLPSIASAATTTEAFSFTGSIQSWTVPAGVSSIKLSTVGAAGGASNVADTFPGNGLGGASTGTFLVSAGQTYWYCVGGQGLGGAGISTGVGGFCGGGNAGSGPSGAGGGGGGMSWFGLANTFGTSTIIQVGAGGGGADNADGDGAGGPGGGAGGGATGQNAFDVQTQCSVGATTGGTQTAGGTGCTGGGGAGTSGGGGFGGVGGSTASGRGAGGGGAGWYGGGGGGAGLAGRAQGGAGGSSFASSTITASTTAQGLNAVTGTITISYTIVAAGGTNPPRRNIFFIH